MPVIPVALSRTPDGIPVFLSEVTLDAQAEGYPIKADELSLPSSPAEITSEWLPGISPVAKELAWQLLDVFRQAKCWGTADVTQMSMHMLTDTFRPAASKVGFQCHLTIGEDDWTMMAIFRGASKELADSGYVVRNYDNTTMRPTPLLVRTVTN